MRENSEHCPAVSVVLPAFNTEKYVGEAVESILSQTFTDFELIVIDDGSGDRTAEILRGYARADARLRILSNGNNRGIPKTRNIGIKAARGRYIAWQDADDISLPERLQKQFDYMEKHSEVALLGTAKNTISDTGELLKENVVSLLKPKFEDLLQMNRFVNGSTMIRKSALEVVGGYDETFYSAEDYELWLRIAKRFPVANLPEVLYIYRVHLESMINKFRHTNILYTLLAREIYSNKVVAEIYSQVPKKESEFYVRFFSKENKIRYHRKLAKHHKKFQRYSKALEHYLELKKVKGASWNIVSNILRCKFHLLVEKIWSGNEYKK